MHDVFESKNELEAQLLAAQSGEIDPHAFMTYLLGAQVFMPVVERHQIANFQSSDHAQPLLIEGEGGEQALVLFTSPERAKAMSEHLPPFSGGLLTEFKWILEKAGVGYGIVLNPGFEAGFELESEAVRQLAADARQE